MFLLGQANLRDQFTRFETLSTKPFLEGTRVIKMYPKRKSDLQDLIMEVDPVTVIEIRRLILGHSSDGTPQKSLFFKYCSDKQRTSRLAVQNSYPHPEFRLSPAAADSSNREFVCKYAEAIG